MPLPAGEHRLNWDGRRDGGAVAPGGLYFVHVVRGARAAVDQGHEHPLSGRVRRATVVSHALVLALGGAGTGGLREAAKFV